MKCFTHPQVDAVAQCSQCHKGTCTTCAHDVGEGAILCPSCLETALRQEVAHARRSITGVWIFTGIITAIGAIVAFATISQSAGAIFIIPIAFLSAWCLYWGWLPVWRRFRRLFAGGGCAVEGWVGGILICIALEILVGIAMWVGLFTGIQKYNEAKRIVANADRVIAEAVGVPSQQLPGNQGSGRL